MDKKEFTATVSKMGRHKMISVPTKNPIKPGDKVTISPQGVGRTKEKAAASGEVSNKKINKMQVLQNKINKTRAAQDKLLKAKEEQDKIYERERP